MKLGNVGSLFRYPNHHPSVMTLPCRSSRLNITEALDWNSSIVMFNP